MTQLGIYEMKKVHFVLMISYMLLMMSCNNVVKSPEMIVTENYLKENFQGWKIKSIEFDTINSVSRHLISLMYITTKNTNDIVDLENELYEKSDWNNYKALIDSLCHLNEYPKFVDALQQLGEIEKQLKTPFLKTTDYSMPRLCAKCMITKDNQIQDLYYVLNGPLYHSENEYEIDHEVSWENELFIEYFQQIVEAWEKVRDEARCEATYQGWGKYYGIKDCDYSLGVMKTY